MDLIGLIRILVEAIKDILAEGIMVGGALHLSQTGDLLSQCIRMSASMTSSRLHHRTSSNDQTGTSRLI